MPAFTDNCTRLQQPSAKLTLEQVIAQRARPTSQAQPDSDSDSMEDEHPLSHAPSGGDCIQPKRRIAPAELAGGMRLERRRAVPTQAESESAGMSLCSVGMRPTGGMSPMVDAVSQALLPCAASTSR